jgi:FkbM family methyltransferase
MNFYSQFGDDYLVWKFFNEKTDGFFIEVGAFDGKHLSNTYFLEQQGWDGICIEPFPKYFDLCKKKRNSHCINAACTNKPATSVKFWTEEDGLFSRMGGNKPPIVKHKQLTPIEVPGITLNQAIEQYPTDIIDFLSVDVEGLEVNVLKGLNFKRHQPRLIIAESNSYAATQQLDNFLISQKGYTYAGKLGRINRYYVQNQRDVERLRIIPVVCHVFSEHPFPNRPVNDKNIQTKLKLKP